MAVKLRIVDPYDNPQTAPGTTAQGATPVIDPYDDPDLGAKLIGAGREVVTGTKGAAPFGAAALSSIIQDPQAKIRYFSRQMEIPEEKFGVIDFGSHKGQIAYETPDKRLQIVNPSTLGRNIAGGIGPSFPAVGGAIGSVAGLSAGPGGAIMGGGAGAVAGQGFREFLANRMAGQSPSPARMAREGMIDAGASVMGLFIGKGLERAAASRAADAFEAFMKKGGQKSTDALKSTVDWVNNRYKTSIRLTPAELTNAAELRGMQMGLESRPATSQTIEDFAANRGKEAGNVLGGFLNQDMRVTQLDPDIAGGALSDAAGQALKKVLAERAAVGGPPYETAMANPVRFWAPELDEIMVRPSMRGAMKSAQTLAKEGGKDITVPVFEKGKQVAREAAPDLRSWHYIKRGLDRQIEKNTDVFGNVNTYGRAVRKTKDDLLGVLYKKFPELKAADELWADLSKPVNVAEGGILVKLANATPKEHAALGTFIESSSAAEISRARARILNLPHGKETWDNVVSTHIMQRWEDAGKITVGQIARPNTAKAAQPAKFWAAMQGNSRQAERMRAAMSTKQAQAWRHIMNTFEATARATNFNSATASIQQANRMLDQSNWAGRIAAVIFDPVGERVGMKAAGEAFKESMSDRNLKDLAALMTNDAAVEEILKIGARNTPRDKAIQIIVRAFELAGRSTIKSEEPASAPSAALRGNPRMAWGR